MTVPTDKSAGLPGDSGPLAAALAAAGIQVPLEVFAELPSTQDWLLAQPPAQLVAGRTVITEFQSAGRGRQGRSWTAPAGSGLMMSTVAVLPPADPRAQLLPVVAGVAVAAALRQWLPAAALKWPNDLVVPAPTPFKLGGLVAARQPAATDFIAVVGIGVNLRLAPADRPVAHARALADFVEPPSRDEFAVAVLQQWLKWLAAAPAEVLGEYRRACLTLGQAVRVLPVGGAPVVGTAVDVAASGALQVATADGLIEFAAADVEHLRLT